MRFADVQHAILADRVRITDHADEEAHADALTWAHIRHSVLHGEPIEDYPNANPYPACLIYAIPPMASRFTASGRTMRSVGGRC